MRHILKIRVIPGALKVSEIKQFFPQADKFCKHCGCRLNYWANMPSIGEFHDVGCPYSPEAKLMVSLEQA